MSAKSEFIALDLSVIRNWVGYPLAAAQLEEPIVHNDIRPFSARGGYCKRTAKRDQQQGDDSDWNIDVKDPAPTIVVGDPASER
jgi:hypothetical protein